MRAKERRGALSLPTKTLFNWFVPETIPKLSQILTAKLSTKLPRNCPRFSPLTGQQNRHLISPDFFLEIVPDLETVPQIVHGIVSKVVPQIDRKIAPKIIPDIVPDIDLEIVHGIVNSYPRNSRDKRLKRPSPDRARKKEGHYHCQLKPYSIEHRIQFSLVTSCVIYFLGGGRRGENIIFVIIISKRRGRGQTTICFMISTWDALFCILCLSLLSGTKIQQTKMLVVCKGLVILFGLVWQYSSIQTKCNRGRFKVMATYLQQ